MSRPTEAALVLKITRTEFFSFALGVLATLLFTWITEVTTYVTQSEKPGAPNEGTTAFEQSE
jgi:hypothetical protein